MMSQLLVHIYYVSKELVASMFSLRSPRKETQMPGRVLCIFLKNDPELILRKPHGLSLGEGKELN